MFCGTNPNQCRISSFWKIDFKKIIIFWWFWFHLRMWQCSFKSPVSFHPQRLLWRLRPEPNLRNTILTQRSVPGDRDGRQVRSSLHACPDSPVVIIPETFIFLKMDRFLFVCAELFASGSRGREGWSCRPRRTETRTDCAATTIHKGASLPRGRAVYVKRCRVSCGEEGSWGSRAQRWFTQERNNIQTATLFLFVYTRSTAGFTLKQVEFSWRAVCYCINNTDNG